MNSKLNTVKNKIADHMLLGSVYDNIIMKTKYNSGRLSFLYNVMVAQKHRMLYYKKLKKKYFNRCTVQRPWEQECKKKKSDTIWFCWLQGLDNAPLLVKRCYESLCQNIKNKQIVVLDESNISEYVKMPDYIVEKWKRGIIGMAHFTDMVRLELLRLHGGYWIDSTVFCTDSSLLNLIDDEPLFMYSFYYFGFNPEIMELNNWFMYSCTNNNILCLVQKFLYEYWKDYNRPVDYFIFHIFMTMAVEFYSEEYKKMPVVSQVDSHVLATYIFDEYDERKFEILKKSTGFHKLSTRFDEEGKKKSGTFYDVVIKKGKIIYE